MGVENLPVEQRASNGFEFLNLRGPEGWRERINLDLLDIDHEYFCILGQVYSETAGDEAYGYEYAVAEFGFDSFGNNEDLIFHGFYAIEDGSTLTAAWRHLLRGEVEPLKAPVVDSEDRVKEGQCGYQSAYGLPWSEYCVFPKGEYMQLCPGHARDHYEHYGRRA
ncbi:hypothetical protein AB0O47_19990 [Streptomyces noursei]|uniref:hypothetical protein n=1 Tax=Streptomyces noursei TaxID=1971 RepID=UPI00344E5EDE